jgi:hypothetical protein
VIDWENRALSKDLKVRAIAEAALVQAAGHSLPLLRRFLKRHNEDLHQQTFEIIRQIGPPAHSAAGRTASARAGFIPALCR